MSIKKFALILITCLQFLFVSAQTDSTAKLNWLDKLLREDKVQDARCFLKIAPLSLISPYVGPSGRIGLEYKLKGNWWMYNEVGYFFVYKGALAKAELKYYFSKPSRSGDYFSAELFYKYQAYNTSDTILKIPNYQKDYHVTKNVECLTFKYGHMTVYKFGLVLDFFVGAGVRFKQATNTLTTAENNNIKSSSDYGPNVFTNRAGNFIYPNIDAGIKVGYRFK